MGIKTLFNPVGGRGIDDNLVWFNVTTIPSTAVCTLTYNGVRYVTKKLKVPRGSTVAYNVNVSTNYYNTNGTCTVENSQSLTVSLQAWPYTSGSVVKSGTSNFNFTPAMDGYYRVNLWITPYPYTTYNTNTYWALEAIVYYTNYDVYKSNYINAWINTADNYNYGGWATFNVNLSSNYTYNFNTSGIHFNYSNFPTSDPRYTTISAFKGNGVVTINTSVVAGVHNDSYQGDQAVASCSFSGGTAPYRVLAYSGVSFNLFRNNVQIDTNQSNAKKIVVDKGTAGTVSTFRSSNYYNTSKLSEGLFTSYDSGRGITITFIKSK